MALYLQVAITACCTRLRSRQRRHERSRVQAGQIVRNRRIKGNACPIAATARSASNTLSQDIEKNTQRCQTHAAEAERVSYTTLFSSKLRSLAWNSGNFMYRVL
jgi:hypothetical protein